MLVSLLQIQSRLWLYDISKAVCRGIRSEQYDNLMNERLLLRHMILCQVRALSCTCSATSTISFCRHCQKDDLRAPL